MVDNQIFEEIYRANPKRNLDNLTKRLGKIAEEYGEAWNAYLGVVSELNHKGKSWTDFREELVDCFILVVDCLYTQLPDDKATKNEIDEQIIELLRLKIKKWRTQIEDHRDVTMS